MTGHLRLLACNGHCAIALLPAQQLLGINSSPIQNGEYRESPVVGVVLESVYSVRALKLGSHKSRDVLQLL